MDNLSGGATFGPLQALVTQEAAGVLWSSTQTSYCGPCRDKTTSLKESNATLWTSALVPALSKPTEDKLAKTALRAQCRQARAVMDTPGCTLHPLLLDRAQLAEKLKL